MSWFKKILGGSAKPVASLAQQLVNYPPNTSPHVHINADLKPKMRDENFEHFLSTRDQRIKVVLKFLLENGIELRDWLRPVGPDMSMLNKSAQVDEWLTKT